MSNKRSVILNQTLNSKYDGDFQFANIYCQPLGNANYENRDNDSGNGRILAGNASF